MKKFTKLFLSCAAMAAVTAAVATSAMAAAPTISATYEDANLNGELTLSVQGVTGEVTLLVTQKDIAKDTVSDADILYIDQETATDAGAAEFGTAGKVGLKTNSTEAGKYLQDGTYNVYVGYTDGEFKIAKNTFRIGKGGIVLGNVNGDTNADGSAKINLSDATAVIQHFAKVKLLTDDSLLAADVDENGKYNLSDATCIIKYFAKYTEGTGHVGEER